MSRTERGSQRLAGAETAGMLAATSSREGSGRTVPWTLRRRAARQHLGFRRMKLIVHFWPPELWE